MVASHCFLAARLDTAATPLSFWAPSPRRMALDQSRHPVTAVEECEYLPETVRKERRRGRARSTIGVWPNSSPASAKRQLASSMQRAGNQKRPRDHSGL